MTHDEIEIKLKLSDLELMGLKQILDGLVEASGPDSVLDEKIQLVRDANRFSIVDQYFENHDWQGGLSGKSKKDLSYQRHYR